MERMNDEGQWIVLIGFIVAISLFFLAIVISESTLVGQTTSEAVLDFSKANIQDLTIKTRDLALFNNPNINTTEGDEIRKDIEKLYGTRKGVIINITTQDPGKDQWYRNVTLHYNDGITSYDADQLDYPTGV
jgi:large exoprotein involved in heme utilization and adhesion